VVCHRYPAGSASLMDNEGAPYVLWHRSSETPENAENTDVGGSPGT